MPGLLPEDEMADSGLPEPVPEGPGLFGDVAPAAVPASPQPIATPPVAEAAATPYRVLARKYRPTRFEDMIGQDAMVRILRNAFALNRIAHAFMLTGVRGVGKTTTARIIARALNCVGPDGQGGPTADPCGVCPNCVAILADRHPDVVEMDAASRTGVDDVREIIEATRFRPLQARAKVFIIDEVHMLSRNAFNALLKTLEEPPPHVKFIFATTEIRKVPVTVLSRCQRFDLRRIGIAELAGFFGDIARREGVEVTPDALDLIARAADGSARDGLSLLDQAIAQHGGTDQAVAAETVADMLGLADRGALFDLLQALVSGNPADALAIADRATERGADLGLILADLLDLVHTLSRIKSVPALRDSTELPEAERTRGAALADQLSMPVLGRAWQMLLKGVQEVETAPDRRAAADMVLIRLCYVADLPTPSDLVRKLQSNPPSSPPASPPSGGGGGGGGGGVMRAVVNGSVMMAAAPSPQAAPQPQSFRELVALVAERRAPMLHAHLLHSVHLVRFAPPVLEIRVENAAPKDFSAKLGTLLQDITGTRWTVVLSSAQGEPTIFEQGSAAEAGRRANAAENPLVRAILDTFPGATISAVHDARLDAYGLPAEPMASLVEPDLPEFAPPDAILADDIDPLETD